MYGCLWRGESARIRQTSLQLGPVRGWRLHSTRRSSSPLHQLLLRFKSAFTTEFSVLAPHYLKADGHTCTGGWYLLDSDFGDRGQSDNWRLAAPLLVGGFLFPPVWFELLDQKNVKFWMKIFHKLDKTAVRLVLVRHNLLCLWAKMDPRMWQPFSQTCFQVPQDLKP